jgi:hypothetical protein
MRVAIPHKKQQSAKAAKQALLSTALLISKPVFITLLSGQPYATAALARNGGRGSTESEKILDLKLNRVCAKGCCEHCVVVGAATAATGASDGDGDGVNRVANIDELMLRWSSSDQWHSPADHSSRSISGGSSGAMSANAASAKQGTASNAAGGATNSIDAKDAKALLATITAAVKTHKRLAAALVVAVVFVGPFFIVLFNLVSQRLSNMHSS